MIVKLIITFNIHFFNFYFIVVTTQVRFAHTDLRVPDFTPYRRESVKNADRKSKGVEDRNAFTYLLVGGKLTIFFS